MNKLVILAAVACVLLAGGASAKSTGERPADLPGVLCDGCKALVEQAKANFPQVRPQLDQLCNYCGTPEANKKCLDKLHELEDEFEKQSPEQVCQAVGLCAGPSAFQDFVGLF